MPEIVGMDGLDILIIEAMNDENISSNMSSIFEIVACIPKGIVRSSCPVLASGYRRQLLMEIFLDVKVIISCFLTTKAFFGQNIGIFTREASRSNN